jgi:hypothetical protein
MFKRALKFIAIMAGIASLSGCAAPVQHNTPSGKVEAVMPATTDQVKSALVSMMVNTGYNISKDTPYLIAFDKPSDNIMASVLLGSKYDATPNVRVTFMFAPQGLATRVIADFAIITNPGSAFERITPLNGSQDTMKFQALLDRMAANPPPAKTVK